MTVDERSDLVSAITEVNPPGVWFGPGCNFRIHPRDEPEIEKSIRHSKLDYRSVLLWALRHRHWDVRPSTELVTGDIWLPLPVSPISKNSNVQGLNDTPGRWFKGWNWQTFPFTDDEPHDYALVWRLQEEEWTVRHVSGMVNGDVWLHLPGRPK